MSDYPPGKAKINFVDIDGKGSADWVVGKKIIGFELEEICGCFFPVIYVEGDAERGKAKIKFVDIDGRCCADWVVAENDESMLEALDVAMEEIVLSGGDIMFVDMDPGLVGY